MAALGAARGMNKIDLRGITLCAVTTHPNITAMALKASMAGCVFGDVVMFTPNQHFTEDFRVQKVDIPLLLQENKIVEWYDDFILRRLASYISTPFTLIVQWDGWVINPGAWREEFLAYDYIGARWPWLTPGLDVGNGGFSLRSKRLLLTTQHICANVDSNRGEGRTNEDAFICQRHRKLLEEKYNCRFPTGEIADQFSYEHARVKTPTFGFHDIRNFYKHCTYDHMIEMAEKMPDYIVRDARYGALVAVYEVIVKSDPDAQRVVDALKQRSLKGNMPLAGRMT